MAGESVYRVTDLVGTSKVSWEDAVKNAVSTAAKSLRDLRVAEVTRFDVTISRRTRAFHHYSVGGELTIEDEEVLSEAVEDVVCRWCGSGKAVEVVVEP